MRNLPEDKHLIHATNVDRDDPFLAARLTAHAKNGVGRAVDYSTTRRVPATVEERFALIRERGV